MFYSAIGVLALLILFFENQDILLNRNHAFGQPAWRVYRQFLITVSVYYITDILWGFLESRKLSALLFADTSLYFIAMAVGVLFLTKYTVTYLNEKNKFGRYLLYTGRVIAVAVALLVTANIFTPILFTVDQACVYNPQNARYAVLIAQILLLLLISVYAFSCYIRNRRKNRLRYRTLALFGLIMAVFLSLQLQFPYLPLYAIAYMLATCLLHAFVIGDEKEEFRHGLEEAQRIAELKQSITSLLDNMPVLSFSKDVKTGAYLACNQSFAEYAHKDSPADVAGLTDFEIFDPTTAARFVADDQKALKMEKPYTFFEDVADALGNPRQFQTTKLKFFDESGRLCLLGMSADMTEIERIRKENELTKAAYQEALTTQSIYENMVDALSEDYFDLYYVDLKTDEYIEYGSKTKSSHRLTETRGTDFFSAARRQTRDYLFAEDQDAFLRVMTKEHMLDEIKENGTFVTQYRLLINGEPTYVRMKATRQQGDADHIIIGVNNIDDQMKDRLAAHQAIEERKTYLRLSALTGNLLVLFVIDPIAESYKEYNASAAYEGLGIEKQGADFFQATSINSKRTVHPADLDRFLASFTKENILNVIQRDGAFILDYRLIISEKPIHVQLKATMIKEDEKPQLIIGLMDIDAQVRREQEYASTLSAERSRATQDALTGIKNKTAYVEAERQLNEQIEKGENEPFAVVVCDINNLKIVNDTLGHKAGDQYIRQACAKICGIFQNSQVFRIGGDEFAVICQGNDYERIDDLLREMDEANNDKSAESCVQVACGMARYKNDKNVESVFERADQRMYEHKAKIKD